MNGNRGQDTGYPGRERGIVPGRWRWVSEVAALNILFFDLESTSMITLWKVIELYIYDLWSF